MEYNLYIIAELNYKKAHPELEDELFPIDWYLREDYKFKTELIAEALEKNVLVTELDSYKEKFIKS